MEYEHHVESNFPVFGIEDCRACHNAGKFNVPNQGLSMPGVLSNTDFSTIRNIAAIGNDVITGPATRACGACHRAEAIIANAGAGDAILLANLNAPYDHVRLYAAVTAGRNYGRYHQVFDRLVTTEPFWSGRRQGTGEEGPFGALLPVVGFLKA